jgi:transcriptional regulator with XRE-family HTH domain
MSPRRLPHYLRSHRKACGLSQSELATLLGCESGAKVSRYERFARQPTLEAVLGCVAVFGVPASELFGGIFAGAQDAMAERARGLVGKLEGKPQTPTTLRKLDLLRRLAANVGISPHAA